MKKYKLVRIDQQSDFDQPVSKTYRNLLKTIGNNEGFRVKLGNQSKLPHKDWVKLKVF